MIGQAFEGVPWGFFIANSPAYASEIVPMSLRGACTATLQMSWSVGSIIVGGATYALNQRNDEWAWRIPLALQWIFPVGSRPFSQKNAKCPLEVPAADMCRRPFWSSSFSPPNLHIGSSAGDVSRKPYDPSSVSVASRR